MAKTIQAYEGSNNFEVLFNSAIRLFHSFDFTPKVDPKEYKELFDQLVNINEGWDGEAVTPMSVAKGMISLSKRDWRNILV